MSFFKVVLMSVLKGISSVSWVFQMFYVVLAKLQLFKRYFRCHCYYVDKTLDWFVGSFLTDYIIKVKFVDTIIEQITLL